MRDLDARRLDAMESAGIEGRIAAAVIDYDPLDFRVPETLDLPLPDEPMVAVWREYLEEADEVGPANMLRRRLLPLAFPVRPGMSRHEDYVAALRRGVEPEGLAAATGLELERPDLLRVELRATPAGRIPLVTTRWRPDFVALVQALAGRNEPIDVPPSQGAAMIGGLTNWDRIRRHKRAFLGRGFVPGGPTWNDEFRRLSRHKEMYQDRLILLSSSPYSNVPADRLGLDDDRWQQLSMTIRAEHEASHYFTRRLFGLMRVNLRDELMADYQGLVAAIGRYDHTWFMAFMGLDGPSSRTGTGRFANYLGTVPPPPEVQAILADLLREASRVVETFDRQIDHDRSLSARARATVAMASLTLDQIALSGPEALARAYRLGGGEHAISEETKHHS